jgi:cell division protein FtsB
MAPSRARRRLRSRHVRRWLAAGALVLIGLLYYKPVRMYFETRRALAGQAAEVRGLQREKARLNRRVTASTSPEALGRAARRLGFVKPGERLFIVKGIPAWRAAHSTLRARERG